MQTFVKMLKVRFGPLKFIDVELVRPKVFCVADFSAKTLEVAVEQSKIHVE